MSDSLSADSVEEAEFAHPVLHFVAPLVVIGATYAVRKVLSTGYSAVTGRSAPEVTDRSVHLGRIIAWTAATAVATALVEVAIVRYADRRKP